MGGKDRSFIAQAGVKDKLNEVADILGSEALGWR